MYIFINFLEGSCFVIIKNLNYKLKENELRKALELNDNIIVEYQKNKKGMFFGYIYMFIILNIERTVHLTFPSPDEASECVSKDGIVIMDRPASISYNESEDVEMKEIKKDTNNKFATTVSSKPDKPWLSNPNPTTGII